jgi:hypothetical protein
MKEFNENPFAKNTEVIPFSNGTEARVWQENNCENCINYETESENEDEANCKLAFHLDLGYISGNIPLWVAKEIGCKYDPLYGDTEINEKCRQFRDGSEIF